MIDTIIEGLLAIGGLNWGWYAATSRSLVDFLPQPANKIVYGAIGIAGAATLVGML